MKPETNSTIKKITTYNEAAVLARNLLALHPAGVEPNDVEETARRHLLAILVHAASVNADSDSSGFMSARLSEDPEQWLEHTKGDAKSELKIFLKNSTERFRDLVRNSLAKRLEL